MGLRHPDSIRALEREDAKNVVIVALTASDYEEDAKKLPAGWNERTSVKSLWIQETLMRVIHKLYKIFQ